MDRDRDRDRRFVAPTRPQFVLQREPYREGRLATPSSKIKKEATESYENLRYWALSLWCFLQADVPSRSRLPLASNTYSSSSSLT